MPMLPLPTRYSESKYSFPYIQYANCGTCTLDRGVEIWVTQQV